MTSSTEEVINRYFDSSRFRQFSEELRRWAEERGVSARCAEEAIRQARSHFVKSVKRPPDLAHRNGFDWVETWLRNYFNRHPAFAECPDYQSLDLYNGLEKREMKELGVVSGLFAYYRRFLCQFTAEARLILEHFMLGLSDSEIAEKLAATEFSTSSLERSKICVRRNTALRQLARRVGLAYLLGNLETSRATRDLIQGGEEHCIKLLDFAFGNENLPPHFSDEDAIALEYCAEHLWRRVKQKNLASQVPDALLYHLMN